jgi:hypothetical protein
MKITRRHAQVSACLLLLAVSVPSAAGLAAASSTSPATQIKTNWLAFFSGSTSADRKIALVQDGPSFAKVIKSQASSPLAQSVTAKVSKVVVDSKSSASVNYSLNLGGKPALSDQKGVAIFQGGTWKVGAQSFCSLLALEQVKPAICAAKP